MNSKILNLFFFKQFFVLILFFPLILIAQTKEVTWNYPVHHGTDEWKQLNSFSERLDAFNIPADILTEMTTENLVKTCLNYPYWILILSRDNNQDGYDFLKSVFNGFRELESRKEAGGELLKIYQAMMPENIITFNTLVDQGNFSYQITYIETLISQIEILKNLSRADLVSLKDKTLEVYNSKTSLKDKYAMYNFSTTCLILGRILEINTPAQYRQINETFPDFSNYIKTGKTNNKKLLDKIAVITRNSI
jgi:hypothetical protein